MRYSDARLLDHLASAYVLGTLAGGARRRFERLRRDRSDVELRVAHWEDRLGRLARSVEPASPSPDLWRRIEARTLPAAAPRGRSLRQPASWGVGLGGMIAGGLAATLLFLASPGLFITADQIAMRTGERLPASYVGLLTDAAGNGKLLVSSLRHGRTMTVKVIGPIEPPPAGKRYVLWAAAPDGAPFVLGGVPLSGAASSALPDASEKLLSQVRKLFVTLEDSAAPAVPGAVIYSGNCAKLW